MNDRVWSCELRNGRIFAFLTGSERGDHLAQIQVPVLRGEEEGFNEKDLLVFIDAGRMTFDELIEESGQVPRDFLMDPERAPVAVVCTLLTDQVEHMVLVCDLSETDMNTWVYAWSEDPVDPRKVISRFRASQISTPPTPTIFGQMILAGLDKITH